MIRDFISEKLIYILAPVLAVAIAALCTPMIAEFGRIIGAVDIPDGKRKLHTGIVPRIGGIAVYAAFAIVSAAVMMYKYGYFPDSYAIILVGSACIMLLGFLDDVFDLPALMKFSFEVVIAVFTVLFGGTFDYLTVFGTTVVFGVWGIPITVFWLVLLTNSINLIDGIDGLATGTSSLALLALAVSAVIMGDDVNALIAVALFGATMGFLPYNSNPASIFIGDCGALTLGYIMGCISIFGFFKAQAFFTLVIPSIIFALPLFDAVIIFFKRLFMGVNPFKGDRLHIQFIMLDLGFSVKQSVAILYVSSAVLAAAAILFIKFKLVALTLVFMTFEFLFFLKHAPSLKKKNVKPPAAESEGSRG